MSNPEKTLVGRELQGLRRIGHLKFLQKQGSTQEMETNPKIETSTKMTPPTEKILKRRKRFIFLVPTAVLGLLGLSLGTAAAANQGWREEEELLDLNPTTMFPMFSMETTEASADTTISDYQISY